MKSKSDLDLEFSKRFKDSRFDASRDLRDKVKRSLQSALNDRRDNECYWQSVLNGPEPKK